MTNHISLPIGYKNQPKVYGIDDDYTDGHPMLSDLLSKISIDGDTEKFIAKVSEIAARPHSGHVSQSGKVSSVTALLAEAYNAIR